MHAIQTYSALTSRHTVTLLIVLVADPVIREMSLLRQQKAQEKAAFWRLVNVAPMKWHCHSKTVCIHEQAQRLFIVDGFVQS